MPQLSKSQVSLVINGDEIVPEEITQLLGYEPTKAFAKGDILVAPKTGRERVTRHGHWRLSAGIREPANLDEQITELIEKLTPNLDVWKELTSRFDIQLFASLSMIETNEGCEVSPESRRALSERHIELGLDIYANLDAG